MFRCPHLLLFVLPVLVLLAGCAGTPVDLFPQHDEVLRLVAEAERLSDDATTRRWTEAATALRAEALEREANKRPEWALMSLAEARQAALAAVASAEERRRATAVEACFQDAADAHRSWEDALQMLEQTERVAERTARGVTRLSELSLPDHAIPEQPPVPLDGPSTPAEITASAAVWKGLALNMDVPFADLEWVWTRGLGAADAPEVNIEIREHQLRKSSWAVATLAKRVQGEVARERCDALRAQGRDYAEYRDQAMWAMVDLERGMKDSARRDLEEERSRMEDRQQKLFESLQQFEGKFASIRREARGTIMSLADILFDFDKATLRREAELNLAKVAVILQQYPEMHIYVEGHTDNVGTEEYNQTLSEERAQAVYEFLATQDVVKERMETAGFGFSQPVESNETEEGRQKNRRVDLVIRED